MAGMDGATFTDDVFRLDSLRMGFANIESRSTRVSWAGEWSTDYRSSCLGCNRRWRRWLESGCVLDYLEIAPVLIISSHRPRGRGGSSQQSGIPGVVGGLGLPRCDQRAFSIRFRKR